MTIEVVGHILRETDAALLLETGDGDKVWLPFSQIEVIHRERGCDRLEVTDWIAEKKGLDR